jgi:fructose-bisphosphate aldolase, class I
MDADENGAVPNTFSAPSNLFSTTDDAPEIKSAGLNTFIAPHHSSSVANELIETAKVLVYPRGRGIYATDESPDVIEAAFVAAGKDKAKNEAEALENRKNWREAIYEAVPSGSFKLLTHLCYTSSPSYRTHFRSHFIR